jgi:hypothetical protein
MTIYLHKFTCQESWITRKIRARARKSLYAHIEGNIAFTENWKINSNNVMRNPKRWQQKIPFVFPDHFCPIFAKSSQFPDLRLKMPVPHWCAIPNIANLIDQSRFVSLGSEKTRTPFAWYWNAMEVWSDAKECRWKQNGLKSLENSEWSISANCSTLSKELWPISPSTWTKWAIENGRSPSQNVWRSVRPFGGASVRPCVTAWQANSLCCVCHGRWILYKTVRDHSSEYGRRRSAFDRTDAREADRTFAALCPISSKPISSITSSVSIRLKHEIGSILRLLGKSYVPASRHIPPWKMNFSDLEILIWEGPWRKHRKNYLT